jgi:hypothetical protein
VRWPWLNFWNFQTKIFNPWSYIFTPFKEAELSNFVLFFMLQGLTDTKMVHFVTLHSLRKIQYNLSYALIDMLSFYSVCAVSEDVSILTMFVDFIFLTFDLVLKFWREKPITLVIIFTQYGIKLFYWVCGKTSEIFDVVTFPPFCYLGAISSQTHLVVFFVFVCLFG